MIALPRRIVTTNSPWESRVGYARAVRVGTHVYVSGTTAFHPGSGELVGIGSAYEQTKQILANIESGLHEAGATMQDVVRTRIFVVNIADDAEDIGRAHREAFAHVRPAATMVAVAGLIDPDMLVEIEADAVVQDEAA